MRRTLELAPGTKIEWKSHDSSIQQRTAIEESRREKANNNHGDKRTSTKQQQRDQPDSQRNASNT